MLARSAISGLVGGGCGRRFLPNVVVKHTPRPKRVRKPEAPPVRGKMQKEMSFSTMYILVSGFVWTIGAKLEFFVGPVEIAETFIILPFQVYRNKFKEDSMGQGAVPVAKAAPVAAAPGSGTPSLREQLLALRTLEADVIATPERYGSRVDCLQKIADIAAQKKKIKEQVRSGTA